MRERECEIESERKSEIEKESKRESERKGRRERKHERVVHTERSLGGRPCNDVVTLVINSIWWRWCCFNEQLKMRSAWICQGIHVCIIIKPTFSLCMTPLAVISFLFLFIDLSWLPC